MRAAQSLFLPGLMACIACGGRIAADSTPGDAAAPSDTDAAPAVDANSADDATVDAEQAADAAPDVPVDAGDLAPCLSGPRVFFVRGGPGNPIATGTAVATASDGTWTTAFDSESDVRVWANTGDASRGWMLELLSPWGQALVPGEYDAGPSPHQPPFMDVIADGGWCPGESGEFDIADLEATPGDSATVIRLLVSFELTCPDGGAPLRGCVHYEQ